MEEEKVSQEKQFVNKGGKAFMEPSTATDKIDSMNINGDEDVVEDETSLLMHQRS